jgi:ABC-type transport system substrate-binding protein
VEVKNGVRLLDEDDQEVRFSGGSLKMSQLTSRFEFAPGLTWSDGWPVSQADYELGYKIYCDPETYGEFGYFPSLERPAVCEMIQSVRFIDDRTYEVDWKPGFRRGCNGLCAYFLPPFSRLPAHVRVEDGRRLGEVPAAQWSGLEEVYHGLPGVGPYQVSQWTYGEQMTLTANPYYYLGEPVMPTIVIRFIPQGETVEQLIQGKVDVLGWDSITPEEVEKLMVAQQEGVVRTYVIPSAIYELVEFKLK